MAPDTKTVPIQSTVQFSGTVTVPFSFTWNGTLQSAILQWSANGLLTGIGTASVVAKVNGIQVFGDPDQVIVAGVTGFTETPQSINIANWLIQGNNVIEFDVIQVAGSINTDQFAVNGSMVMTTTGTIIITPPPPPPPNTLEEFAIIIVVIIVIAVAGGLFLRARG